MTPTTRQHPRSSILAFPKTVEYATSLEPPEPRYRPFWPFAIALTLAWLIGLIIVGLRI